MKIPNNDDIYGFFRRYGYTTIIVITLVLILRVVITETILDIRVSNTINRNMDKRMCDIYNTPTSKPKETKSDIVPTRDMCYSIEGNPEALAQCLNNFNN